MRVRIAREAKVRIFYKGEELCSQRLDMVVDERVIVEIKSTIDLPRTAHRQLYNYLQATNLEIGLLFHFGRRPRVLPARVPQRAPPPVSA